MANARIFDKTYRLFGKALDTSARRHNLISSNIANMDTIGYRPKDLDFNKTLERVMAPAPAGDMEKTNGRHFDGSEPPEGDSGINGINGTEVDESDEFHLDTVDIDTEMLNLAGNNFRFRSTAEMMLRKMTLLKHTIAEGGK